ncbi:hypothetical protein JB92DRAFT_2822993 [Gautieria morchelliformis]|nr:hypothetical protein JB92DRAFT_2822993 [Gautieria morchelliformis]
MSQTVTDTLPAQVLRFTVHGPFPPTLASSTITLPKLDRQQTGHLRHIHNLASQLDGEWTHMGALDPAQEWLDAYRYQLATMAYAAGAAHYHHLPVLRGLFQELLLKIIHKMLRREVWGYWYLTSQSGKLVDPDIKELRRPWADPVVRENIMYSGHLLLMVTLYAMLFDDDRFDQEDALTFHWDPVFWGMGPEKFSYTTSTLQQAILNQMEQNGWAGVCCEPNSIFVVCNQFPIIGMRYNDVRKGTKVVDGVVAKYAKALQDRGMINGDGLFAHSYAVKQAFTVPAKNVGFTAWAAAFMNAWNHDLPKMYPTQSLGFITRVDPDRINVNTADVAFTLRRLAKEENCDVNDLAVLARARDIASLSPLPASPSPPFPLPIFGYVVQWVSEVSSSPDDLAGLLNHADRFLGPTWENGGLFYPRHDTLTDKDGNWTQVEPFTGNAGIAYARLNVPNGQRRMWDAPWTKADVQGRAWVDGVGLGTGVDFLRGGWDVGVGGMVLTMSTWHGGDVSVKPVVKGLKEGLYGIYIDGHLSETRAVEKPGDEVLLEMVVGAKEVDVVLKRAN